MWQLASMYYEIFRYMMRYRDSIFDIYWLKQRARNRSRFLRRTKAQHLFGWNPQRRRENEISFHGRIRIT